MLARIVFSDNEKLDLILKRILLYGALVGMISTAIGISYKTIDEAIEVIATEEEVIQIDTASMTKHLSDQAVVPYAMKSDINHIVNIMIDEQIGDAMAEIEELEDKEDVLKDKGKVLPPVEARKLIRLNKQVEKAKGKYVPEPGALHSHE